MKNHPKKSSRALVCLASMLFVFFIGLMELRAGPGSASREAPGVAVAQEEATVPTTAQQHQAPDSVAAHFFRQIDQLHDLVMRHHPELRALQSSAEAARAGIEAAGTFRDPELRIRKDLNPMGDGTGLSTYSVSVMQPLPWFGTYQTEKEKEAGVAAVAEQRWEVAARERREEVALVWLEITNHTHQKTMLRESLERLEELIRLSRVRYEAGRQSRTDLLRLEMERETAKQQIVTLERATETLMATLVQLAGGGHGNDQPFPTPMAQELPEPNLPALLAQLNLLDLPDLPDLPDLLNLLDPLNPNETVPLTTDSLMAWIRTHHPVLQIPRLQRDVLEAESRRVHLQSLPSFGVGVELMGRNAGVMGMFPDSGEQWAGMISVRMPVYRSVWRAKQEQIRRESQSLGYREQQLERTIAETVTQLLTEWKRRKEDREFYAGELLPRLNETVAILKEEYRSDQVAIDEILTLERERFRYLHEQQEAVIDQYRVLFRLQALLEGPLAWDH
jgi:outer membrane protein TolC